MQLRLLAPFLPFVTEEVWSWWHQGSIHRAPWPDLEEFPAAARAGDVAVLDMAAWVLGEIRKAKTAAKVSMRAPVARVVVTDSAERIDLLATVADDVRAAGSVAELVSEVGPPGITVELAPPET